MVELRDRVKSWRRSGRHPRLVRAAAGVYRQSKELRTLLALPFVLVQLRRTRRRRDPEALIDLAYYGYAGSIRPYQVPDEIRRLMAIVSRIQPKRMLEIGTAGGGTLFLLARSAPDDAHVISVDQPGGWFGGGYPRWKGVLYRNFAVGKQTIDLIRADSHATTTRDRVISLLDDEPLDFVLIDGDHTYEGAKRDFESYAPLVRPGGVVAFHDIVPNAADPDIGVDRFWKDIKPGRTVRELVADPDQGYAGIGVIVV